MKKRPWRRSLYVLFLAVCCLGLASGCSDRSEPQKPTKPPEKPKVTVPTPKVETADVKSIPTSAEKQVEAVATEVGQAETITIASFQDLLKTMGEDGIRKLIEQYGLQGLKEKLGEAAFASFIQEQGLGKLQQIVGADSMKQLLQDPMLKETFGQAQLDQMLEKQGLKSLMPGSEAKALIEETGKQIKTGELKLDTTAVQPEAVKASAEKAIPEKVEVKSATPSVPAKKDLTGAASKVLNQ